MRAMPKSVSSTRARRRPRRASIITLSGLTSRWTMPCACAAPSAARHARADQRSRSRAAGARPPLEELAQRRPLDELADDVGRLARRRRGRSRTRRRCPSCLSPATACASRRKRRSMSPRPVKAPCMTLMATSRASCGSKARYTVAIPPRPSSALTRYRPSVLPTRPTRPESDSGSVSWASSVTSPGLTLPQPAPREVSGLAPNQETTPAGECERPAPPTSHTVAPPPALPPRQRREYPTMFRSPFVE